MRKIFLLILTIFVCLSLFVSCGDDSIFSKIFPPTDEEIRSFYFSNWKSYVNLIKNNYELTADIKYKNGIGYTLFKNNFLEKITITLINGDEISKTGNTYYLNGVKTYDSNYINQFDSNVIDGKYPVFDKIVNADIYKTYSELDASIHSFLGNGNFRISLSYSDCDVELYGENFYFYLEYNEYKYNADITEVKTNNKIWQEDQIGTFGNYINGFWTELFHNQYFN